MKSRRSRYSRRSTTRKRRSKRRSSRLRRSSRRSRRSFRASSSSPCANDVMNQGKCCNNPSQSKTKALARVGALEAGVYSAPPIHPSPSYSLPTPPPGIFDFSFPRAPPPPEMFDFGWLPESERFKFPRIAPECFAPLPPLPPSPQSVTLSPSSSHRSGTFSPPPIRRRPIGPRGGKKKAHSKRELEAARALHSLGVERRHSQLSGNRDAVQAAARNHLDAVQAALRLQALKQGRRK